RHRVDAWHPRLIDQDEEDEAETAHVVRDGVAPNGCRSEYMANDYSVADAENVPTELLRDHGEAEKEYPPVAPDRDQCGPIRPQDQQAGQRGRTLPDDQAPEIARRCRRPPAQQSQADALRSHRLQSTEQDRHSQLVSGPENGE